VIRTNAPFSLHDLSFSGLGEELANSGIRPSHAHAVWRALYGDLEMDLRRREDFTPPLRRWIEARQGPEGFTLDQPETAEEHHSTDGLTRKFLLRLRDGQAVETVLMNYEGRRTACLSTQAGCAMGCVFCATGQTGFTRHLRPGEIVAQVLHCQRDLRARGHLRGLRNLVLMGMGEPLQNYDAVMQALEIISDTRGLNIGPSRITVSTVGIVPGILRLAQEKRPYNLAVSLHGANEADRGALVPINKRWPLSELIAACRAYSEKTGRKIFFQWTLIAGVNDSAGHAEQLGTLLAGMEAHVNLIPLNPTDGFSAGPSAIAAALHFQRILRAAGIPNTVRQRRGIDVSAGCGQLRSARTAKAGPAAAPSPVC
jgi:23S rRNA (adenine2503-C2)-methyltransferase